MKKILVTGSAGFIGFHLVNRILKDSQFEVVGLDNINDYYDINLKYDRLAEAGIIKEKVEYNKFTFSDKNKLYRFVKLDLADKDNIYGLFDSEKFDFVINLAAQAGVRYSLINPHAYIDSNIIGFLNILEASKNIKVKHLIYASTSSVYGLNGKLPFSETDGTNHPVSLYGATKKSNELMAHAYSHSYNLPTSGLRFFTVYGPWGRPDMALFLFTKAILDNKPIDVYNYGNMQRDFTYVDDIVESIYRLIQVIPTSNNSNWNNLNPNPSSSFAPYTVFNIGNNKPIELMQYIEQIEIELGTKANKNLLPLQQGDFKASHADSSKLYNSIDFSPNTSIDYGIKEFINWYKKYYSLNE